MKISYKKQRYEIAQEVALHLKRYYDEGKKEQGDFNAGYLLGLETAYSCFRNRMTTYKDIDESELTKLGVADELWNVDIKHFYDV